MAGPGKMARPTDVADATPDAAARREAMAPSSSASVPEYPDEAKLRAYGELSFLALREARFLDLPLSRVRAALQPAIDLDQHRVFRHEGVPRSAVTWAFLSPDAERRFAGSEPLTTADWRSGRQMWVMDIIAPYAQGTGAHAMNWLRKSLPPRIDCVRWLRLDAEGRAARVLEARRGEGNIWGASKLPTAHFEQAGFERAGFDGPLAHRHDHENQVPNA